MIGQGSPMESLNNIDDGCSDCLGSKHTAYKRCRTLMIPTTSDMNTSFLQCTFQAAKKTLCKLPEAVFLAVKVMNHFYDQHGKISK